MGDELDVKHLAYCQYTKVLTTFGAFMSVVTFSGDPESVDFGVPLMIFSSSCSVRVFEDRWYKFFHRLNARLSLNKKHHSTGDNCEN